MKTLIDSIVRFAYAGTAGFLLYGWRGSIATMLILVVLAGLIRDHATVMVRISQRKGS